MEHWSDKQYTFERKIQDLQESLKLEKELRAADKTKFEEEIANREGQIKEKEKIIINQEAEMIKHRMKENLHNMLDTQAKKEYATLIDKHDALIYEHENLRKDNKFTKFTSKNTIKDLTDKIRALKKESEEKQRSIEYLQD